MIPPNPFQSEPSYPATNMPGSFLPAIPASLPSYPKHHSHFHYPPQQSHSAQSPSPTLAPTRKRLQQRRPADTPPSSYNSNNNYNYDSDEDVMRNSLYSDTAFRTSLAGSRKRGLADEDAEDGPSGKRVEVAGDDGRPAAKRRIIDVVGSVASRVWEFCISKTPFYSGTEETVQGTEEMEFEREIQRHMKVMPGGYSSPQFQGQGSGEAGMGIQQNYFPPTQTYSPPEVVQPQSKQDSSTGGLSSRWVMVSPTPIASTASARPSTAQYTSNSASRIPRPYTAPNIYTTPPYSPTTYATTATSTTTATATVTPTNNSSRSRRNSTASGTSASRRPTVRPVVAASSRAKRPAVVRGRHTHSSSMTSPGGFSGAYPAPPQSAFTFGGTSSPARGAAASAASTRSRRKLTGGSIAGGRSVSAGGSFGGGFNAGIGKDDDEDEADESIRRFNEKLKDMIREGREALGSRIEVTYDDDEYLDGF